MRRAAAVVFAILQASVAFAACSWNQAPTNVAFGNYAVFSPTALTATSTFQFRCNPPSVGTLTLSRGSSPTYNPRTMQRTTAPVTTLSYNLFMDAANTTIWGDGTSGTQYLTFVSEPRNQTYSGTIYATIPAGLDAATGNYSDTIQATLAWGGGSSNRFFTVTATVPSSCTTATTPLNFGAYDQVSVNAATPLDSTAVVNVDCTIGTLATVALNLGAHASGTTRRMLGSTGSFLTYEVYNNSGRTVVWNGTNTESGTSTSKNSSINGGFVAYGRIFAGQDVGIGSYSDTLLVTVNY